ncbi:MAG: HEAT repeat domain-containing protein [Planctomycetes bacterium]|nr:HEAT repeat domain-containing protein [Planctomycetota bacterium]
MDNDPLAAIEMLQGLVDETSVIQYRGQTSIIMAQTYRAHLRAGQKQSAATLLPFIRRESLGTEFYTQAETIIADAQAYQNPEGELNPGFLRVVVNQLIEPWRQGVDISPLAQAYGTRLTPYLKEILQWEGKVNHVAGALSISAISANREVLDFYIHYLEDNKGEIPSRLPEISKLDDEAKECYSDFLIKLSRLENIVHSQRSIAPLMELSSFEEPAYQRLSGVLADPESLLAPFVQKGFMGSTMYSPKLLADAIMKAPPDVADELRNSIRGFQSIEVLRLLIDAGDEKAVSLLPLFLLPEKGKRTGPAGINFQFWTKPCIENWGGVPFWGDEDWRPKCPSVTAEEFSSQLKPYAKLLQQNKNPEIQKLGLMVAIHFQDWELALSFLETMPTPENLAILVYSGDSSKVSPVFLPYLERVVNKSPTGKYTASVLLNQSDSLSKEFLLEALDPELEQYFIHYLDGQPGNKETADLLGSLLNEYPPRNIVNRILFLFPKKGLDRLGDAIQYLVQNSSKVQNLSSTAIEYEKFIGDYLRLRIDKGDPIDPVEAQNFSKFIYHSLWGDWIDYDYRSTAISLLASNLRRLIIDGDEADLILEPFLEDPESAKRLLDDLQRVVAKSPKLMEGIVEKYPELIHSDNWYKIWVDGEGCRSSLLNHPDAGIIRGILTHCLLQPQQKPELKPLKDCVLRALDNPVTASVAARLAVKLNLQIDLALNFQAVWDMPDLVDRHYLIMAIGGIYDERLMPIILKGIRYPDSDVLLSAESALARYTKIRKSEEALLAWQKAGKEGSPVDALVAKLSSSKLDVRIAAIESLGTMGAAEALPFLVELMEDGNAKVAAAAAAAVKKINSVRGESEEG